MKIYHDIRLVIPKNEDANPEAAIVIQTNNEKETVTISKKAWGSDHLACEFPRQFLHDVIGALSEAEAHNNLGK